MTDLNEQVQVELNDIDMDNFFSDEEEFTPVVQKQDPAPVLQKQDPEPVVTKEDQEMNDEFAKVNIDYMSIVQADSYDRENPVFLYRMFYSKLFPYKTYFQWLNYDITPTKSFTHREFSFTLHSDIYLRFKSFPNGEALKKEIERLQPIKIDIGAVYAIKPKDKKTVSEKAFKPIEKELVFDIDMTDYDEVRTCCTGGNICLLCWDFMTVAIKVIDASLRKDFGFQHIMWVYSGRRGVHCWVCDERARKLDNECRKAIVNFLEIVKGGAQIVRKVKLPAVLHPSLTRSLNIVEKHFKPILLDNMGILDNKERWSKLLDIIPDENLKEKIDNRWSEGVKTPKEKWALLIKEEEKLEKKKKFKDHFARDIMLQYCYPRLDAKVSININHLLKSPFCVHPKTLKVCVPIKVEDCDTFNPLTVPNLIDLRKEMLEHDKLPGADTTIPDYKKTSLKPYIEYFDKFVKSMLAETIRDKRDAALMSMEF